MPFEQRNLSVLSQMATPSSRKEKTHRGSPSEKTTAYQIASKGIQFEKHHEVPEGWETQIIVEPHLKQTLVRVCPNGCLFGHGIFKTESCLNQHQPMLDFMVDLFQ